MAAKSKSKVKSREARRQTTPTTDIDKPAKAASPTGSATTSTKGDHLLHVRHAAGITKKRAKPKPLSRHQRLRKEKGFERAAVVTDQLDKKVGMSKSSAKKIKERSNDWDQVNMRSGVAAAQKVERKANKQKKRAALKQSSGNVLNNTVGDADADITMVDDASTTGAAAVEVQDPEQIT